MTEYTPEEIARIQREREDRHDRVANASRPPVTTPSAVADPGIGAGATDRYTPPSDPIKISPSVSNKPVGETASDALGGPPRINPVKNFINKVIKGNY